MKNLLKHILLFTGKCWHSNRMTKMNLTSLLRIPAAALMAVLLASCDKDFNELGADIVGDDHFLFEKDDTFSIVANTIPTGPVQTNNLQINPFGVYSNPALGKTVASFVTQLEIKNLSPLFASHQTNPVIDSVVLYVPYFSTLKSTDAGGAHTYELDSIFGQAESPMQLAVHESQYFLRDFFYNAQDEQESQRYYSNQRPEITYNPTVLNNGLSSDNEAFFFSADEHEETVISNNGNTSLRRVRPGMRLKLDNDYFTSRILGAPQGILSSNNAFKNYFRGLYFKVDPTSAQGQLAMINFGDGTVTLYYKETQLDANFQPVLDASNQPVRIRKEFVMNMKGNTVSLLQNIDPDPHYTEALAQSFDAEVGQEVLALKGGEGSVVVIDLFGPDTDGNGVADQLEEIRQNEWLINEASLTFHINKTPNYMGGTNVSPKRIYLYDVKNKKPLVDYYLDNTTGGFKNSKYVHGGLLERESGNDTKYKIRITNYLRNLVKAPDSTNVRLGLSVTESINIVDMGKLRNPDDRVNNFIPAASIMNPLGTFLYGTHPAVPEDKRLKLEIYYTKRKP